MYTIPRYRSLEGVAEISLELDGVALGTLEPCDTIRAQTRNSVYEIYMLDPGSGRALIRGGEYFAEPREATVSGSTFGAACSRWDGSASGFRWRFTRMVSAP